MIWPCVYARFNLNTVSCNTRRVITIYYYKNSVSVHYETGTGPVVLRPHPVPLPFPGYQMYVCKVALCYIIGEVNTLLASLSLEEGPK